MSCTQLGECCGVVRVPDEEDNSKQLDIRVTIKPSGRPMNLKRIVEDFETNGAANKMDFQPLDAIQYLNIILNYSLKLDSSRFVVLGRKFFDPNKGNIPFILLNAQRLLFASGTAMSYMIHVRIIPLSLYSLTLWHI